jgi:hypothetical protein
MKWSCERSGLWVGADADGNAAEAHRIREGSLYANEWMWSTELNGEWIANAESLAHAKRAVAEKLAAQQKMAAHTTSTVRYGNTHARAKCTCTWGGPLHPVRESPEEGFALAQRDADRHAAQDPSV